jgi:hypothetical protein
MTGAGAVLLALGIPPPVATPGGPFFTIEGSTHPGSAAPKKADAREEEDDKATLFLFLFFFFFLFARFEANGGAEATEGPLLLVPVPVAMAMAAAGLPASSLDRGSRLELWLPVLWLFLMVAFMAWLHRATVPSTSSIGERNQAMFPFFIGAMNPWGLGRGRPFKKHSPPVPGG